MSKKIKLVYVGKRENGYDFVHALADLSSKEEKIHFFEQIKYPWIGKVFLAEINDNGRLRLDTKQFPEETADVSSDILKAWRMQNDLIMQRERLKNSQERIRKKSLIEEKNCTAPRAV